MVDTTNAAWVLGLVPGLQVLPLHAWGSEHVALVRWAPGTVFQPHGHPSGEEIFVLDGVFHDEQGSYPAGSWLRSPPGSVHRPWSEAGCTNWVKDRPLAGNAGGRWLRRGNPESPGRLILLGSFQGKARPFQCRKRS